MDFNLNEDQVAIQDMARQFTHDRITPNAGEWDEHKIWPVDVAREAGELGFGGIYISEDMGGVALTRVESALIFEQLSYGCPSTSAMISIHNMAAWMIDCYGDQALREKYVPSLASLSTMASYCLTEAGAGLYRLALADDLAHFIQTRLHQVLRVKGRTARQ